MLLLESCPSYQSRPSTMTHLMHLFLIRMGRLTRCKIAALRYYNTLHDSRMAYPTQRNVQCCQQDGRLNYNLIIKKTLYYHYHACRQWLSRVVFLDSEHFAPSSAGILLNGYDFTRTGAARTGAARLSAARQGAARQGQARQGEAWLGLARRGKANTLRSTERSS